MRRWLAWVMCVVGAPAAALAGCGGGDGSAGPPGGSGGGSAGDASVEGGGGEAGTGGVGGTGGGTFTGGSGGGDSGDCGGTTCPASFKCRYDACVPDLGTCESYDDCPGDSYCDANGECIPYGVPPSVINDPSCQRETPPDGVKPTVQCEWLGPTDTNDPTLGSVNIYTAPIVADLNLDDDPGKLQPSIVVTTFETIGGGRIGTLRVFDGRTCEEQLRLGGADDPVPGNRPGYGTQWAVGDLDGDVPNGGRPEIVGLHNTGSTTDSPLYLYALKLDVQGGAASASRMWYGRKCSAGDTPVPILDNAANFGPGLWDLDNDGRPEILVDEMVFDAAGCLLNDGTALDYLQHGVMSTIADVDLDGKPDLVRFDKIAGWDEAAKQWVTKSWFVPSGAQKAGHVAVVDLGNYSTLPGVGPGDLPEVVVVSAETTTYNPDSTGTIRVQALDGTVVWGPMELHHDAGVPGGHGGPPTASDFDGDGQVEFAAAANQYYVVYDPDCKAALGGGSPPERPGGKCDRAAAMQGLPDGILWAQPSQDFSSSGTGSSIFDFDGDGKAEAVYGDECYVRVYEGHSGQVLYSAPASSGTGFELPVIVDVDGDFATEIVVARTDSNLSCPVTDPLLPTTPFVQQGGFVILRDPEDLWAASRPIWNQHAYSITHVTDDAQVPQSSQMPPNWTQPGLNNFRQNTQGDLGILHIADLTVVLSNVGNLCAGQSGTTTLEARVCNRGTNPVQDGVTVQFLEADASSDGGLPGTVVCETETTTLLKPGECEEITCTGDLSGQNDVYVVVDPEGSIADCHPGNNDGAGALALCPK